MKHSENTLYWCNNLTELLWTRGYLQNQCLTTPAILVGPVGLQAVFEMDDQPIHCIEYPDWLQKSNSGWLSNKKLNSWLTTVWANKPIQRVCFWSKPSEFLIKGLNGFTVSIEVLEFKSDNFKARCLMAGPRALSIGTHHYRSSPPDSLKLLVVIDLHSWGDWAWGDFISKVEFILPQQHALARRLQLRLQTIYLAVGELPKLARRELVQSVPNLVVGGIGSLIGHLAYADQVIGHGEMLPLLCEQMRRQTPILL